MSTVQCSINVYSAGWITFKLNEFGINTSKLYFVEQIKSYYEQ